ncbi:putative hydroxyethylthiazole kinase [Helianthus anomalus]
MILVFDGADDRAMKAAAGVANQLGKPWVLDPAAVGAYGFRIKACLEFIELKHTVVRGNGSDIIALSWFR